VLVLVEPTSAVDAHTEARIAERLAVHRRGRTTVVTSVSPLLLHHADRVVFLADGRLAGSGTHEELLASSPGYRRVVGRTMDDAQTSSAQTGDGEETDHVESTVDLPRCAERGPAARLCRQLAGPSTYPGGTGGATSTAARLAPPAAARLAGPAPAPGGAGPGRVPPVPEPRTWAAGLRRPRRLGVRQSLDRASAHPGDRRAGAARPGCDRRPGGAAGARSPGGRGLG